MNTPAASLLFAFESPDAIAIWRTLIGGVQISLVFAFAYGGWPGFGAGLLAFALLAAGMRVSVCVSAGAVVVRRTCFWFPYRTYRAAHIDSVCFGGDWGLTAGASGVVIEMGGRKVHVGTAKTMVYLHDALAPLSASVRQDQAAAIQPA